MITIAIDIAGEDAKHEVQGYATESKFLGVHKGCCGGWNVTHLLSGFCVKSKLPFKKDAMQFADEIKDKLDWSQSAEMILVEFHSKDEKPFI